MQRFITALSFSLLAAAPAAQALAGTIRGTLRDYDGPVVNATVQARNVQTNALHETRSRASGYTLSDLPDGTYEIAVPPLGWRTDRFVQSDVRVRGRQALELNIELTRGNLGVVGDDVAYLALFNKYDGIEGATPRTATGKPDLSGVWLGNLDPDQTSPDLLPWASKEFEARRASEFKDMPQASCLPDPIPITPTLYKFVQSESLLVQIIEGVPAVRQVFLDGRPHPEDLDPSWNGHSVGRWESDTLVVETVGFNDLSWLLYSSPHTEKLRVTERFSRPDLAHLNLDVTMEDPGAFKTPWDLHMVWTLAPGEEIGEYVCNENNKYHENIAAP
jgi:Carboxypeptidase regulatory-like domain